MFGTHLQCCGLRNVDEIIIVTIIIIQRGSLISLENSQNSTNKMQRFSNVFVSARRSTRVKASSR